MAGSNNITYRNNEAENCAITFHVETIVNLGEYETATYLDADVTIQYISGVPTITIKNKTARHSAGIKVCASNCNITKIQKN